MQIKWCNTLQLSLSTLGLKLQRSNDAFDSLFNQPQSSTVRDSSEFVSTELGYAKRLYGTT